MLLALLLCLLSPQLGSAQVSPILQGISAIRLRVSLNAKSSATIPIDTAVLMRATMAALHAHGWRVARDRADDSLSAAWPVLIIHVDVFEYRDSEQPDRGPLYVTRFDYGLFETVNLRRLNGSIPARTWDGPSVTTASPILARVQGQIITSVKRIIDEFNAARGPIGRMGAD